MQQQSPEEIAAARRIMACKDFIPLPIRFLLFIAVIIVFQFSGGVYMSAVTQMAGSLSWINEDIMMAGYASLVGLTVAFPFLFRIMFRFTARDILLVVTAVLIVGDWICMVCDNVPVVVTVSFISGFFKMVGTFICWSQIQLNITPKRDFAVFFPFLFTFILGCVQLSNLATGYSIDVYDWQTMHLFTILALILTFLTVYFCLRRHFRQGPYIPFKNIDYLGCMLWSGFLLSLVFVFVYGEYFDWLDSKVICGAILFSGLLLGVCLYKSHNDQNPYIRYDTFRQDGMIPIFILFGCMTLMSSTSGSLQNIFTGAILGFSTRHSIDLNWGTFFGVLFGAALCYLGLVKWHTRIKIIVFNGFFFFFLYQLLMYFLIDASVEKSMLYLPMFFKGAGLCIVYTVLTYALAVGVPFKFYFEAMCVIGFIRTSFGNPMSGAIVTRMYNYIKAENMATFSGEIDAMHPMTDSFSSVYAELNRQVVMVTLKEVYGYAVILGLMILAAIILSDYRRFTISPDITVLNLSHIRKAVKVIYRDIHKFLFGKFDSGIW